MIGSFRSVFEISEISLVPISGSGTPIDGDWRSKVPYANLVLDVPRQNQLLADRNDPLDYAPRVYEAESDLKHYAGRRTADGWAATPGVHRGGRALVFGPFVNDLPPGGPHTVTFRMQAKDAKSGKTHVATLDVFDQNRDALLAQRWIWFSEFDQAAAFQDFSLDFISDPRRRLEFRVWWTGHAYLEVDRVTVNPASTIPLGPWEVKYYAWPAGSRSVPVSDKKWLKIVGGNPLGEMQRDSLTDFWINRSRAANWFATVAMTQLTVPAGRYELGVISDDGMRVLLNGQLVLSDWSMHPPRLKTAEIDIANGSHELRVDHFQGSSYAQLQVYLRPL